MQISTKTRYGLRAMVYLAKAEGICSARKIGENEDIPFDYLGKILARLKREGLIKAKRGVGGGYSLVRAPQEITVGEVVGIFEGTMAPVKCVAREKKEKFCCPRGDICSTKNIWKTVQDVLHSTLDSITLAALIDNNYEKENKETYLDYAATTPVDPVVLEAMLPYLTTEFGNSASMHSFGQNVQEALEKSRGIIAAAMGAKPEEIIFSSSATESNNFALKGVAFANRNKGKHIIISPVEHECILNSAKWLQSQGFEVEKLKVDKYGLVDPEDVERAIKKETILVSVMHANNETGTIEPIGEIGEICRRKGVYFHTDAAQSFGKIPIDVSKMNIDLLTASSHKMYGPKGVACLFVREGVKIEPLLHGGGHESGLRASTVNVPAIVGFAKAADICRKEMKKEGQRLSGLRDKLIKGVLTKIPGSHLNGHSKKRLPNNANFWFEFVEGESIVMQLNFSGIAASTASTCSSPKLEPSHVLLACGLRPQEAQGSLRLSLGRRTTEKDIDYVLEVLPKVIANLRNVSPFKGVYPGYMDSLGSNDVVESSTSLRRKPRKPRSPTKPKKKHSLVLLEPLDSLVS